MGYGNPARADGGWSFLFDFGLFLTGSPTLEVNINSNCSASANADANIACQALVQELNRESDTVVKEYKDDFEKIKFLPYLSIGASYSF